MEEESNERLKILGLSEGTHLDFLSKWFRYHLSKSESIEGLEVVFQKLEDLRVESAL